MHTPSALLVAALTLLALRPASAQESLAFTEVPIPRAELRQQRLIDLTEFRCAYQFTHPASRSILLIAETFRDGKQVGRYLLSLGANYTQT